MSLVLLASSVALALLAAGIATVSLLLHWKRPSDANAGIATLQEQVQSVQTSHLDLLDKVEHWMKRDAVRRTRERQKPTETLSEDTLDSLTPQQKKMELRRRVRAVNP